MNRVTLSMTAVAITKFSGKPLLLQTSPLHLPHESRDGPNRESESRLSMKDAIVKPAINAGRASCDLAVRDRPLGEFMG